MWTVRLLNNGKIYLFNNFEDAYGFARLWNGEKLCMQHKPKNINNNNKLN